MALDAAAAVSEHPIPAHAVGACLGEVLEAGGPGPIAVVVAVTEALVGALEDVVAATRQVLGPETLVAVTVGGVLGGAREIVGPGAVMMFAVWDREGRSAPVRPVRLATTAEPGGARTEGLDVLRGAEGTLVLFTDPFSVDGAELLDDLQLVAPALRVVGGELSAARYAGGNRLVLDAATWTDGAVGLWFGPESSAAPLISRGARPVGPEMTVTEVSTATSSDTVSVVTGLAGRPARARLDDVLEALPAEVRGLAADGLYLGDVARRGRPRPVGPAAAAGCGRRQRRARVRRPGRRRRRGALRGAGSRRGRGRAGRSGRDRCRGGCSVGRRGAGGHVRRTGRTLPRPRRRGRRWRSSRRWARARSPVWCSAPSSRRSEVGTAD